MNRTILLTTSLLTTLLTGCLIQPDSESLPEIIPVVLEILNNSTGYPKVRLTNPAQSIWTFNVALANFRLIDANGQVSQAHAMNGPPVDFPFQVRLEPGQSASGRLYFEKYGFKRPFTLEYLASDADSTIRGSTRFP